MSNLSIQYVQKELNNYNNEIEAINGQIHSYEIEIKTIDSKLNKINKEIDWTENILHSVSKSGNEDARISSLVDRRSELKKEIDLLLDKKYIYQNKINDLSEIISADVSRETQHNLDNNNDKIQIIDYIEQDRQRISRDIHDTVVQNLTALIHKQEFISQIMNNDLNRSRVEISNSISIIKESINELRNIIFELRPMSIDDLGFDAALNNLIKKFDNEEDDIFYNYEIDVDECNEIKSVIKISVMRILTELNSNSVKHSKCKNINIHVFMKDDFLIVDYKDDGCGFDYYNYNSQNDNLTGFGMKTIRERIYLLSGTISYNNNNGSEYIIKVPIAWGGKNNGN